MRTFEKVYRERGLTFVARRAGRPAVSRRSAGSRPTSSAICSTTPANGRARASTSAPTATPRPTPPGALYFIAAIDDDGPGLDPQARAAALERGRRLDESRPGSGLGLSIVVDLAPIYGGSLRLEDSPLGGLRATLRLPRL